MFPTTNPPSKSASMASDLESLELPESSERSAAAAFPFDSLDMVRRAFLAPPQIVELLLLKMTTTEHHAVPLKPLADLEASVITPTDLLLQLHLVALED